MYLNRKVFLFKRNNGVYYWGIEIDGKRRWKSTGTKNKSEALRKISEFREDRIIRNGS
jgi:hypothetical protein